MTSPDPILLQQLAQAHGFRLEALGANRAGRLSTAQAKDLGPHTTDWFPDRREHFCHPLWGRPVDA